MPNYLIITSPLRIRKHKPKGDVKFIEIKNDSELNYLICKINSIRYHNYCRKKELEIAHANLTSGLKAWYHELTAQKIEKEVLEIFLK